MALDLKKADLKSFDLKNIDFKNIFEWPIYGRLVIFGLVCAGVFYGGYFLDFSKLSEQIYTRFKQEQDLKQQVKSILKTEQDMRDIVAQYPQIVKLLNEWQGQLIQGDNLPDLLNQILKLGTSNHLQFSLFVPGTKKLEDDYYMVPIKVVVQGGYTKVANFVSQVANMPQIVVVGDFMISTQAAPGAAKPTGDQTAGPTQISTELILEVYSLAPKKL